MELALIIAAIVAAIGAINWGLVALFNFDLVAFVTGNGNFGSVNAASRLVYLLVAAAGIVTLIVLWNALD